MLSQLDQIPSVPGRCRKDRHVGSGQEYHVWGRCHCHGSPRVSSASKSKLTRSTDAVVFQDGGRMWAPSSSTSAATLSAHPLPHHHRRLRPPLIIIIVFVIIIIIMGCASGFPRQHCPALSVYCDALQSHSRARWWLARDMARG